MLREAYDAVIDECTRRVLDDGATGYAQLDFDKLRPMVAAGIERVLRDLEEGGHAHCSVFWAERAYSRQRQGFPLSDLQLAISVAERVLAERCYERLDEAVRRRALAEIYEVFERSRAALLDAYVEAQSRAIREQDETIRTLSTPILPLYRGVLALPLVGMLDAPRAAQATERLLVAVGAHGAAVVVIDVTGVPAIDAEVAGYLARAAQAVRLLGARVVLAGISAAVARTMVELGVDLGDLSTCANLRAALDEALGALGLAVCPAPARRGRAVTT